MKKTADTKEERVISPSSNFLIPSFIFHDERLSILEAIVAYLKEKENLTYHEIGLVMNRDERNIWTEYARSKKKRGIK
ncbi:hypothetical protein HYU06_01245 [Candidatus Woesearchaeota archaeon]|nr:hypothetical protein [Candidatus Woesearchaeota archaeon]